MFNSKIYTKYFPIKERDTQFSDGEKKILSFWIRSFREEVKLRELSKLQQRFYSVLTYNLELYDETVMLDMLIKNQFDDNYLTILNVIIYRHKYNSILSCFIFPMLTMDKWTKFMGGKVIE